MYSLIDNRIVYEKEEVDTIASEIRQIADTASNDAASALTKADQALSKTERIDEAYNKADEAYNKTVTYDAVINNTLEAAATSLQIAESAQEDASVALRTAEEALSYVPVKYVERLPSNVLDIVYGVKNTTPVVESKVTTFIDIVGTYFTVQSNDKYVLKDNYDIDINGMSFESVYISKETVYCYTSRDFEGMLSTPFNTYDQYSFIITEIVDRMDYYIGNSKLSAYVQLASHALVTNDYIKRTEKGAPGGIATLDTEGHILYSQLPTDATIFRGTWDASTGVYPTEHVTPGDFFIVTVAGTVDGVEYLVDDRIYWTGSSWNVTHAPEGVTSINGRKGIVVLTAADVGALPTGNPGYTGKLSGESCNATGNGVAHGTSTTAGNTQFAVGKYNYQQDSWAFMVGNGTSNAARKNAMGVTNDGVLYVHDIRCVYSDTLQSPAGDCGVLTGHTYVYNSEAAGHNSVSHSTNNHETFTLILQTVPASNLIIQCNITPDANGTIDTFAVHNINILNLTSSTVTIYVNTVNASGTRVEKSVSLPASTKKSVIAIGNELYDLNIPNAIWN